MNIEMYECMYVCSEQLWRVALRVSHDAEGPTAKKAAAGRSEGNIHKQFCTTTSHTCIHTYIHTYT